MFSIGDVDLTDVTYRMQEAIPGGNMPAILHLGYLLPQEFLQNSCCLSTIEMYIFKTKSISIPTQIGDG